MNPLCKYGLGNDAAVFFSRARDSPRGELCESTLRTAVQANQPSDRGQFLKREWFFEERDGNCRLTGTFTTQLSETALTWARAVAPLAEWISRTLWLTLPRPTRYASPATRLTQSRRRAAKGADTSYTQVNAPKPPHLCRDCGKTLKEQKNRTCGVCAVADSRKNLIEAAKLGRAITHLPRAQALRSATQRRHAASRKGWDPLEVPGWLTARFYRDKILPNLASLTVSRICSVLGISEPYASDIRKGRRIPHLRHWQKLALAVGVSETM